MTSFCTYHRLCNQVLPVSIQERRRLWFRWLASQPRFKPSSLQILRWLFCSGSGQQEYCGPTIPKQWVHFLQEASSRRFVENNYDLVPIVIILSFSFLISQLRRRRTSSVPVVWSRVIKIVTPPLTLQPRHLFVNVSRMVATEHQVWPFQRLFHPPCWSCFYSVSVMLKVVIVPQGIRVTMTWDKMRSRNRAILALPVKSMKFDFILVSWFYENRCKLIQRRDFLTTSLNSLTMTQMVAQQHQHSISPFSLLTILR